MSAVTMFKRLIDPADPSDVRDFYLHFRPTIPMDRALLCLDCEAIFEAEGHQTCPACGSATAWAIGRALNREPRREHAASLRGRYEVTEALARSEASASESGVKPNGGSEKRANGKANGARTGRRAAGKREPRPPVVTASTH